MTDGRISLNLSGGRHNTLLLMLQGGSKSMHLPRVSKKLPPLLSILQQLKQENTDEENMGGMELIKLAGQKVTAEPGAPRKNSALHRHLHPLAKSNADHTFPHFRSSGCRKYFSEDEFRDSASWCGNISGGIASDNEEDFPEFGTGSARTLSINGLYLDILAKKSKSSKELPTLKAMAIPHRAQKLPAGQGGRLASMSQWLAAAC